MTQTTSPAPAPLTPDETEKAARLIEEALARGPRPISHTIARLIAIAINEGDGSPLQHFGATGQFDVELAGHEATRVFVTTRQEPWRRALLEFLLSKRPTQPFARSYRARPQNRQDGPKKPFADGEQKRPE